MVLGRIERRSGNTYRVCYNDLRDTSKSGTCCASNCSISCHLPVFCRLCRARQDRELYRQVIVGNERRRHVETDEKLQQEEEISLPHDGLPWPKARDAEAANADPNEVNRQHRRKSIGRRLDQDPDHQQPNDFVSDRQETRDEYHRVRQPTKYRVVICMGMLEWKRVLVARLGHGEKVNVQDEGRQDNVDRRGTVYGCVEPEERDEHIAREQCAAGGTDRI